MARCEAEVQEALADQDLRRQTFLNQTLRSDAIRAEVAEGSAQRETQVLREELATAQKRHWSPTKEPPPSNIVSSGESSIPRPIEQFSIDTNRSSRSDALQQELNEMKKKMYLFY